MPPAPTNPRIAACPDVVLYHKEEIVYNVW